MSAQSRRKVLVAEDEYLIGLDVARAAREAGYEVAGIAGNGEQAVKMVEELKPDAAILDIRMPGMSGLEAARAINEKANIPVVILTAFETPEYLEEAKQAGVGGYLVKPPNAMNLKRAMEIAFARHGDLKSLKSINADLARAMAEAKTMDGILPICSGCKKIRDEGGKWRSLEIYLTERTKVELSHGICPDCMRELYPEFDEEE